MFLHIPAENRDRYISIIHKYATYIFINLDKKKSLYTRDCGLSHEYVTVKQRSETGDGSSFQMIELLINPVVYAIFKMHDHGVLIFHVPIGEKHTVDQYPGIL